MLVISLLNACVLPINSYSVYFSLDYSDEIQTLFKTVHGAEPGGPNHELNQQLSSGLKVNPELNQQSSSWFKPVWPGSELNNSSLTPDNLSNCSVWNAPLKCNLSAISVMQKGKNVYQQIE
jgi:hypothetical protein